MPRATAPNKKLPPDELSVLFELHSNAYDHVRAMVKIRSNYFNFYIIVIGIAFAAYSQIYDPHHPLNPAAILVFSALVYTISVFTMMRAERLTGHIAHDLQAIRRAQNLFAVNFPTSAAEVTPYDPNVSKGVRFDRSLLDRNRSVEAAASILGGAISAIIFSLATGLPCWATAILAILLASTPYLLWKGEVAHLKRRHKACCREAADDEASHSAVA